MSYGPEVRRGGNLPFGMVASLWMCDPRYSANARTLYAILVTYADTQERHTGKGKPYRVELAAQLGVSLSTLDRTLVEMEVAGMVTVEKRPDPNNPLNHDASVYHLHDAGVMWQGNASWADPLAADAKAADIAKELIEARRREKREKGITALGGVPKGVSTKALKAAREAEESEGGGSTHAATPSGTHAARLAAPVLPNVYSPVETPSPDPDASSPRSGCDGRQAPSGSRGRAQGGSAAASKSKRRLTKAEYEAIKAVRSLLPDALNEALPGKTPPNLGAAILTALAVGSPYERTPAQLVEYRVMPRWNGYWASKHFAGEMDRPVGALMAMVKHQPECGDLSCEDRVNIHTRESCRPCEMRGEDRKADLSAEAPAAAPDGDGVPEQRPAEAQPARPKCPGCRLPLANASEPVLCRECQAEANV